VQDLICNEQKFCVLDRNFPRNYKKYEPLADISLVPIRYQV